MVTWCESSMYLKVLQQLSQLRGEDVDESGGASAEKWPTRTGPDLAFRGDELFENRAME